MDWVYWSEMSRITDISILAGEGDTAVLQHLFAAGFTQDEPDVNFKKQDIVNEAGMTKKYNVAVLDDYQHIALSMADWSVLSESTDVTVFNDHLSDIDALAQRLQPFDIICVMRERTPVRRQLLSLLPNLKLIVSTGYRNASIDLEAAAEAGIEVKHTGYHWSGAPELTWALLMAIARKIPQENANVVNGRWQTTVGTDLSGRTIGLVGLGNIGKKIASYAKAFDMRVLAWSPHLTQEKADAGGAELVTKDELFTRADFISVHMVLSDRTRGMIGLEELRQMKPSAYFINTSRGPLVREADLIQVLEQELIAGAALDVFDTEPLPDDHAFRKLKNVLATPHIGYGTEDTYRIFFNDTVKGIADWCSARV